jgi:hypothetical protein
VLQVANVLNDKNKRELLPRIAGKSKSEIDNIIAEYQPPQIIPDQAKPRLVKKTVTVQRALAGASLKSAGRRATGPELGQISLHRRLSKNCDLSII